MKQTRKHVNNTNNISEQDKDNLDQNDKMNIDRNETLEYKNKQYKGEYFEESCRAGHDEGSLITTESVQKQNGQERIKVNFHPVPFDSLSAIDPELENGLKGLSVSGSMSIDKNEQQVKSDGTEDEMKTMENEMNKGEEGINSDHKKETTDIVNGSENIKTSEEESSQVKILIFIYIN